MARCDSYTEGNCTRYACDLLPWVPDGLGNAGDWLADAQALGFATGADPISGAIVVYAPGGGYSDFGHLAVVTTVHDDGTFLVREMNFSGLGVEDYRNSTLADVAGFIYPPADYDPGTGGAVSGAPPTPTGPLYGSWEDVRWWLNSGLSGAAGQLLRLEQVIRSTPPATG